MKAAIAGIILPILLIGCNTPQAPAEAVQPSPALWVVENADGEREGWLFGTIHSLPDGVEWRTPKVQQAIDGSDALVLEISELNDSGDLPAIFTELGRSRSLPPLLERVAPEKREALTKLMDKAGFGYGDFTHIETWAAALTLAQAETFGSRANGVDRVLLGKFSKLRVLEGARAQLSIFDTLPESEQRDFLTAIVDANAQDGAARYDDLVNMWLTGAMDKLAEQNVKTILADAELRAALLTDRNERWATKIDGWMRSDGPLLVAVGASHMAGREGLPNLLTQRGYTVRRVQ